MLLYSITKGDDVMKTDWYELARRWADKCVYCGCTDQSKITFSVCYSCRRTKNSKKNNKGDEK